MTYQEILDRIHGFQKYGSKLGLGRMTRLMELLGNPQESMKVIHVAGTNGKGSVCRYLYSVLQENGYKTGLYTSPFLERFTERMEYNGSEISQEDLIRYTELVLKKVEIMLNEGMESPTEFELITAIAFLYFSEQDIDFLVLEVGLGGTGDSTNLVSRPIASVITSISFDHMEYLGDTLEKIAIEKAGIIKPGVPVIFNVRDKNASEAIRKIADAKGSKKYEVHTVAFQVREKTVDGYTFDT
ncbi:MAG TPA: Mur ligase family protein, partial [Anaerovoracaceae bacterium]|nr:Mur ligase family protein [Anaerovoracaceae bacterium]